MSNPLFIATERFDPSDGDKWQRYCQWANIPGLVEIVSLDASLCPHLIKEFHEEDWRHLVSENYRLGYFCGLDYLRLRVQDISRRNILGLYRNPKSHIVSLPAQDNFRFHGYDLIEEDTQISANVNCGGFDDVFRNDELNRFGLIDSFDRASEIRQLLSELHPEEAHAQCELYAIWRLDEIASADLAMGRCR